MNLTNYRQTPLARVVEFIRREAQRYGVAIHHSELVGLIPEEALVDAAVWYLQLDQFTPEQILERRLQATLGEALQPATPAAQDFLEALASDSPTPGGGSASAYSGAAAAALVAMVARLTLGRKKYAHVEEQMRQILERAETLRRELTAAIEEDAAAFEAVMAAFKLPKDTSEEMQKRQSAIESATLKAAQVPLEVARKVVEVMYLALKTVSYGNLNAISDAATAAALARAALSGAGYNVRINLASLKDEQATQPLLDELEALEQRAGRLEADVRAVLSQRGGMKLP